MGYLRVINAVEGIKTLGIVLSDSGCQYYRTREANPLKKMQALMAVACKLLRVLYAMATKGNKYDPGKLLGDIHRPQKKAA